MEVNELLEEQLTEEQQKALELKIRKENYKKTQVFLLSDDFEQICKSFDTQGEELLEEIKNELKTREKAEAIYSEVDKIEKDISYYQDILSKLGNSEGEEVYKEELKTRIDNAKSNVYIKVNPEELFDLPVYTKLDMLKMRRNSACTIRKYMQNISESFFDAKDGQDNPNPYQEA